MDKRYSCLSEKTLIEGNERFSNGKLLNKDLSAQKRKELLENTQRPMAVVITCSDSRVSPEIIFDVGLGDIFVIRNAGNIVDDTVVENVEFAIEKFEIPYVLVLAHENCGAAENAVEKVMKLEKLTGFSAHFEPIMKKVYNSAKKDISQSQLAAKVEEENVKQAVDTLLQSEMLSSLVKGGKLTIAKGKYYLGTGKVKVI